MQLEIRLGHEELQVLVRCAYRRGEQCSQQQKTRERKLMRAP
jgi:hypothetical protein